MSLSKHGISKAITLASDAHSNQFDKQGEPYILHPIRVMMKFEDSIHRIAAVLHDVVEDTSVSITLINQRFGSEVSDIVDLLTRRKDEKYEKYILRISQHLIASRIKIADLEDNMDLKRWKFGKKVTNENFAMMKRYLKAHAFLKQNIENEELARIEIANIQKKVLSVTGSIC